MNHLTRSLAIGFVFAATAVVCGAPTAPVPKGLSQFGAVDLTAESSTIAPNSVVYTMAHLVAQNGATLDADELRANLLAGGKVDSAVATGHVRAHVSEPLQKTVYTVTADKGIFNPKANKIDLIGNVKAVIDSPMSEGPLIQTGTSGQIYLGKAPEFPKLVMQNVVMTVTPKSAP